MKALMLGGGGHARLLQTLNPDYTFSFVEKTDEEIWLNASPSSFMNGIGVIKANLTPRIAAFQRFMEKGFSPLSFMSRHALCESTPSIGAGTQIMAGVILQAFVKIGANVVINTGASLDHECEIGDHCFLSPRVTLCGGVKIGEGAFLGAGCVILPGVTLKPQTIIKAGEIVR